MPVANYTTQVAEDKTIGEIARMLSQHKAKRIITDYDDDGNATELQFTLSIQDMPVFYRLPVRAEGMLRALEAEGVERKYRNITQARRVAWRCIRDWVRAQMTLIEAEQASIAEAFLPYAVAPDGRTIYEHVAEGKIKLLGGK